MMPATDRPGCAERVGTIGIAVDGGETQGASGEWLEVDRLEEGGGLDSLEGGASGSGSGSAARRSCGLVMANVEALSDATAKWLLRVHYSVVLVAMASLLPLLCIMSSDSAERVEDARALHAANVAAGVADLCALMGTCVWFAAKMMDVRVLAWSARTWRLTARSAVMLVLLVALQFFYLVPNVCALLSAQGLFDTVIDVAGLARASIWISVLAVLLWSARMYSPWVDALGRSVGAPDAILLDAPWSIHWVVFAFWGVTQVTVLTIGIVAVETSAYGGGYQGGDGCGGGFPSFWISVVTVLFAIYFAYTVMYLRFVWKAAVGLERRDYLPFRMARIGLRYEFRTTGLVLLVDFVYHTALMALGNHMCAIELFTWHGVLPLNVAVTGFAIVTAILYAPVRPARAEHEMVVQNSWAEEELRSRKEHLAAGGQCQPTGRKTMFCFETAVKMYYWSEMAYEYDAAAGEAREPFSLETAMNLYDLQKIEYLKEEKLDSNAVLAWNHKTIVLSFRGTYSATNVWATLKAWRARHPPTRGSYWLGTQPLVHKGFLQSWTDCGFSTRVLAAVMSVLDTPEFHRQQANIFVTGHSLGGALAQLAAFDIRRYCGVSSDQLSVYTFGSPRLGNHAFARDYEESVPASWLVVDNLDAIARTPKFGFLYKKAGTRVIINWHGDAIVRPHFLEFKFTSLYLAKVRLADHPLAAYRKSLAAVVGAQFIEHKGSRAGRAAMQSLLEGQHLTAVLGVREVHMKGLIKLGSAVWNSEKFDQSKKHLEIRQGSGRPVFEVVAANLLACLRTGASWAANVVDLMARTAKQDYYDIEGSSECPATR